MNRRTVLAALATATTGVSGCTASDGADGGSESTSAQPTPAIDSETVDATGDCSEPNTASVAFESAAVVVTTESGGGDACMQALVQREYEATIAFEADLPGSVTVVHDSMGSRETVASAER